METLNQSVAPPSSPTITLCGKEYPARKLEISKDLKEIEEHFKTVRANPLEEVGPAIDRWKDCPEVRADLVGRLYVDLRDRAKPPTREEIAAWCKTLDGFVFIIWLALRHNQGLEDRETVRGLFIQEIQEHGERKARERLSANATITPE